MKFVPLCIAVIYLNRKALIKLLKHEMSVRCLQKLIFLLQEIYMPSTKFVPLNANISLTVYVNYIGPSVMTDAN